MSLWFHWHEFRCRYCKFFFVSCCCFYIKLLNWSHSIMFEPQLCSIFLVIKPVSAHVFCDCPLRWRRLLLDTYGSDLGGVLRAVWIPRRTHATECSYVLVRFKKSLLAFFLSVFSAVSATKFSIIRILCFFDFICGFVPEVSASRGKGERWQSSVTRCLYGRGSIVPLRNRDLD